jgi:hypothetical protein
MDFGGYALVLTIFSTILWQHKQSKAFTLPEKICLIAIRGGTVIFSLIGNLASGYYPIFLKKN